MSSLEMFMHMILDFELCFPDPPGLLLQLNRASMLKDTFEQLAQADESSYKKKLVVILVAQDLLNTNIALSLGNFCGVQE